MSGVPLNELYFRWLYSQVADPDWTDEGFTHWELLRALFQIEFVSVAGKDEDRATDGRELRRTFIDEQGLSGVSRDWIEHGCSMLELMVGLAQRLEFLADAKVHYWFWRLMDNLDLRQYNDEYELPLEDVDEAITRVIFRLYGYDGVGGLFPLRAPTRDQRELELWVQMGDYLAEVIR